MAVVLKTTSQIVSTGVELLIHPISGFVVVIIGPIGVPAELAS
jgi:hypothetical protein